MRAGVTNPTATQTVTKTITVQNFPACEYHLEQAGEYISAHLVGVTIFETHAFMCATCFNLYGMGFGLGKRQILVMGA